AGDIVKLTSARGSVSVAAAVTKRLKPFSIGGKTVHQVAIPNHWGFMGIAQGDSANVLAPNTADSNSSTPEFKAFLVKVEKAADGTVPTITGRYKVLED
ncbi:formate dehydrogenase-N subunit alpha, partial [Dehalococcoides mccartyi]